MRSVPQIDSFSISFTLVLCFLFIILSQYLFYIDFFLSTLLSKKFLNKRFQNNFFFCYAVRNLHKSININKYQTVLSGAITISNLW